MKEPETAEAERRVLEQERAALNEARRAVDAEWPALEAERKRAEDRRLALEQLQEEIEKQRRLVETYRERIADVDLKEEQLGANREELCALQEELGANREELCALREEHSALREAHSAFQEELAAIHHSLLWSLGNLYWSTIRALSGLGRWVLAGPRQWMGRGRPVDESMQPEAEREEPTIPAPTDPLPTIPAPTVPAPTVPAPEASETIPSIERPKPSPAVRGSWKGARPDIFCFPIIDWEFRYQRPQQLMSQFADHGHRVYYLRTSFHQEGESPIIETIRDNVFGLKLPGPRYLNLYRDEMPAPRMEEFLRVFEELRRSQGIVDAICIVQLPFWTPLAFASRSRWGWRVIYDCMDEHSAFGDTERAMLESEPDLISRSDLVVTTARVLHERMSASSRRTLLLPNAADFQHFHQRNGEVLTDMPRPIVGYFGAISEWFDVEMVQGAAETRPSWQFVLIGDTYGADVTSLEGLPNVHLLGEMPYDELPAYLHSFDVATIPFKVNQLTRATNPVKFFEYLSAGKPVVAVELPELEPFPEYYYPVRTRSEFLSQLETALKEKSVEKRRARIDFVRQNTWTVRYRELECGIRKIYGKAAVIIVSYNNPEYLRLCLESVKAKTLYPNYEVIVVDNDSAQEVKDYLRATQATEPWLRVILNEKNVGFPRANNIGIRAAAGCEYLVLLNDDVVVTRGWLTRLIHHLDRSGVDLVGPVTNWAGNEARITVGYENLEGMEDFAESYTGQHEGELFDIGVLAMFCVALRQTLLDRIGLLDEQFGIGMFEDDDFAKRVRQVGGRVVCAEDVFIHHWGRSSFKAMDEAVYSRLFEENRRKFEEKWEEPWAPHRYRRDLADSGV